MARARFLVDTVHPDYGRIAQGEVLSVPFEYLRDYLAAGVAEESEDELTRPEPEGASQREVKTPPLAPGARRFERGVGG